VNFASKSDVFGGSILYMSLMLDKRTYKFSACLNNLPKQLKAIFQRVFPKCN